MSLNYGGLRNNFTLPTMSAEIDKTITNLNIHTIHVHLVYIAVFLFLAVPCWAQIPAFPGAEGFGSTTPGGRGGQIIKVTNLNADGPGSLREALETEGPRIVVFETGGTIELNGTIEIYEPYLTIAGQTAPGDGISIKNGTLYLLTNDVIVRGLRFRIGDLESGPDPIERYGVFIWSPFANNIIIDHCSASWSVAANYTSGNLANNVTFSWLISAEALDYSINPKGRHSMGINHHSTGETNISTHHCILAHNHDRNPRLTSLNNEAVNNYVYNYGLRGTVVWLPEGRSTNIINNYFKPGDDTVGWPDAPRKGIYLQYDFNERLGVYGCGPNTVYVRGNVGPGRETITSDDMEEEWLAVDASEIPGEIADQIQVPIPFTQSGITAFPADSLETLLLGPSGAGAIIPHRDPVDTRVLQSILDGTGNLINSQDDVGGWPEMDPGTAPDDSDDDGIPDTWEYALGFDPNDPNDVHDDYDGDGYSNIEEYINGLIPILAIGPPMTPTNLNVGK